MKKVVHVIVAIILIILISYFAIQNQGEEINNEETQDELKEEELISFFAWNISGIISFLEECLQEEEILDCPKEITYSQEEIDYLKQFEEIKGIPICFVDARISETDCTLKKEINESCEEIWRVSYVRVISILSERFIAHYKCGENEYLYSEMQDVGPSAKKLYKLQ